MDSRCPSCHAPRTAGLDPSAPCPSCGGPATPPSEATEALLPSGSEISAALESLSLDIPQADAAEAPAPSQTAPSLLSRGQSDKTATTPAIPEAPPAAPSPREGDGAWPSGPSSSPRPPLPSPSEATPASERETPAERQAPPDLQGGVEAVTQPDRLSPARAEGDRPASEWDTLPPSGIPKPSEKLRREAAARRRQAARQSSLEPEHPRLPLLHAIAGRVNKLPPTGRLALVLLPLALGLLLFFITFWTPPGAYFVQPELTRLRRQASPSAKIVGTLVRGQRVRRVLLRGDYALVLVEPAGPAGFVKTTHLGRGVPELDPSLPVFEGCEGEKSPAACAALAETQRQACEQGCAAEPACARRCGRAAQRCMARCAP